MMEANVSISRDSADMVRIRFRDAASRIEFASVKLTLEAYAQAITGLAEVQGGLEVRGLQYVGKRRITEHRQKVCPIATYDKKLLSAWLDENAQEEGWTVDTHLGSQGSVSYSKEGAMLSYHVTKYVEDTAETVAA